MPVEEAELEQKAMRLALSAATIAEVEAVSQYDQRTRADTVYRTTRHLFGRPLPEYRRRHDYSFLDTGAPPPPPDTCASGLAEGQRAIMVFFSRDLRWQEADATARSLPCSVLALAAATDLMIAASAPSPAVPGGLCDQLLVREPGMIDRIRRAAAKLGRTSSQSSTALLPALSGQGAYRPLSRFR